MLRSLLWGASLCRAHGQDPFCEDEQAFLQIGQLQKHYPSATADKPASLLNTVRNLARATKHESPETVTTLVASIDATIQAMKPPLVTEHTAAQALITTQLNEITACGDSSSYGTDAFAFAELAQCRADVAAATAEKNEACELWMGEPRILGGRDDFPGCLPESPTADQFLAHMEAWSTFTAAALFDLRTKKSNCETKTSTLAGVEGRCAEEESEFDDAFCGRKTSCVLLHACHDHEVSVYDSLIATLRDAEVARQAQYRSITQIECILGLIDSAVQDNSTIAETALDTCDGDANADHLLLDVPASESLSVCPSPAAGDPQCPSVDLPRLWTAGEAQAPINEGPNFIFGEMGDAECPVGYSHIHDASVCREAVEAAAQLDSNPEYMSQRIKEHPPRGRPQDTFFWREAPCGCVLYHHNIGRAIVQAEDVYTAYLNTNDGDCGYREADMGSNNEKYYAPVCQCQSTSCELPARVNYEYFLARSPGTAQWECPEGTSPVTEAECSQHVMWGIEELNEVGSRWDYGPPGCFGYQRHTFWSTATEDHSDWRTAANGGYYRVCKRPID